MSTVDRRILESGKIAIDAPIDFLESLDRRRAAIVMKPSVVERKTA
ncbi:hypothetical protein [Mesorhizobium hawassense]|nr:hypothetical protein [Mesorhizobium hawassense]